MKASMDYEGSKNGTASADKNDIGIGDIIAFGAYDWRVLDIQGSQALIVSEYVIEEREYHTSDMRITWANSSIRTYLNEVFYNSSEFSDADRSRIAEKTIPNENNQWYGTDGGQSTSDRIFLLSISEVVKYFGDSGQLANRPISALTIDDQHNFARSAIMFYDTDSWWWLRSPGRGSNYASCVGDDGPLYVRGDFVNSISVGVRPALWLNL